MRLFGAVCFGLVLASVTRLFAQGAPPEVNAAPPIGTPTITITSPVDGSFQQGVIEVAATYTAGEGRGNPHVTRIEVLLNGSVVGSTGIQAKQGSAGTIILPGVDVSSIANTGFPGTLIARAFQGNANKNNFGDSAPINITVDTAAPIITSPQPADGSSTTNATPTIAASWDDPVPGAGISIGSAIIKLDNAAISASVTATGFTFTSSPIAAGSHTVSAQVSDLVGNPSAPLIWTFTVISAPTDTTPPVILNLVPANGTFTNNQRPQLSAQFTDSGGSGINPASVVMTLNSIVVSATVALQDANTGSVSFAPTFDLGEGPNSFAVSVADNSSNNVGPITSSFTVDVTPPNIIVVAPAQGATFQSTSIQVDASVIDEVSGPSLTSLQVFLNNSGSTGLLSISSTSSTNITIQGTLTGLSGSNDLRIVANDTTGNISEKLVTFSVGGKTDAEKIAEAYQFTNGLPDRAHSLAVVSPTASIDVLSGRLAEELLTVRVTDSLSPGHPVGGVPVQFEIISGSGYLLELGAASVTNDSGQANIRFVAGPKPGPVVVRSIIRGQSDVSPVQFQLNVRKPSFTIISTRSPCNFGGGFTDRVGSALPELLTAQLLDHNGQPVKGAAVKPRSVSGMVEPVGRFFPELGVSDANGLVRFAFVIDQSVDQFTLELRTIFYLDENGDPLKAEGTGSVIPESGPVKIVSGQGQIGAPGLKLPITLRVQGTDEDRPVFFSILEGSGAFSAGDVGSIADIFIDSCGNPMAIVNVNSNREASVSFTPSTSGFPILIDVGPASDVFVVGMPEGKLISSTGQDIPVVSPDRADGAFKIEFKLPANIISQGGPVTAKIRSLNPQGAPVALPIAVAPFEIPESPTGPTLPMSVGPSTAEYIRVRSEDLFAVSATTVAGPDVSALPGKKLQMILGGLLISEITTGFGTFESMPQAASKIRRDKIVSNSGFAGPTLPKVKITLTNAPGGDLAWTIKSVAGSVKTPVNAGGMPLANAKGTDLWLQFVNDAADVDMAKAGDEVNPVRVLSEHDTASRRAEFEISVKKAGGVGDIDKRTIFVTSGTTGGIAGGALPPATDADVQARYTFWTGKEPDETKALPDANKFAPIGVPGAPKPSFTQFKDKTGKELAVDKRIFIGPTRRNSLGLTRVLPAMPQKPGVNEFEFTSNLVQGTLLTETAALFLDRDDMDIIAKHEERHVLENFAIHTTPAHIERRIALHIYNQFWGLDAANQTAAFRANSFDEGVLTFTYHFNEITVRFKDFQEHAPVTSKHSNYLLAASHVPAYVDGFNKLCDMLARGAEIGPTEFLPIVDDPADATTKYRTDLIAFLVNHYTTFPLPDLKGGKWNVKPGAANAKTPDPNATISGEYILKPVEE